MARFLVLAALAASLLAGVVAGPAYAAGCLKGAAIGGVAGHFMGHHGLLGAGAGCLIGHHEAAKHARESAHAQRLQEEGSSGNNDHAQSSYGR